MLTSKFLVFQGILNSKWVTWENLVNGNSRVIKMDKNTEKIKSFTHSTELKNSTRGIPYRYKTLGPTSTGSVHFWTCQKFSSPGRWNLSGGESRALVATDNEKEWILHFLFNKMWESFATVLSLWTVISKTEIQNQV